MTKLCRKSLLHNRKGMPSGSLGDSKIQAVLRGMDTIYSIHGPCRPKDIDEA